MTAIVLLMLLMAACAPVDSGGSSTGSGNTGGVPTPTREGDTGSGEITGDPGSGFGLGDEGDANGFAAELTGAITETVINPGTINCENNTYVIRGALDQFPQISLILPEGASPGNFTLVDNPGDGSAASASVFLQDGSVYAAGVEGILIVNNLATEAGQPVTGSFDFSANSPAGTLNARGEFDFVSGADSVYC